MRHTVLSEIVTDAHAAGNALAGVRGALLDATPSPSAAKRAAIDHGNAASLFPAAGPKP